MSDATAPITTDLRLGMREVTARLDAIDSIHRALEDECARLRRERDSALAELDRVLGENDG